MTTRAYPGIAELKNMLMIRKEIEKKEREASSLGFFQKSRKAALEREVQELNKRMETTRQRIIGFHYPYDHPIMLAAKDPDSISFGRLTAEESASRDVILWQLIDVVDNKALLLSRYALFTTTFHSFCEDVTYEDSTVRGILNEECFNGWFSPEERKRIELQSVLTGENSDLGDSQVHTMAYLFLLSEEEAKEYLFPGRLSCQGLDLLADGFQGIDACVCWWLRTPGESLIYRKYVTPDGHIDIDGTMVDQTRTGSGSFATDVNFDVYVRPAMWIRLAD